MKPIQIETILHLLKAHANNELANPQFGNMVSTAHWLGWPQVAIDLHRLNLPQDQHIAYLESLPCPPPQDPNS